MCGICGLFSFFNSDNLQFQYVNNMSLQMVKRGPDDEGYWTDYSYCSLGFRRLSILDLSPTGHQPMISSDDRFALVFNGEIYNFLEIRESLKQRGIRFRSTGDSEVVLYALAEWGIPALEKFNGMFALAFYDRRDNSLLLARDHAGIKPLYYLRSHQGLVFASQYNQIVQHPWASNLEISQEALSMYLRFGWIPAPYGILEKTHLLQAGCWLKVDATQKISQGRFYEFPQCSRPVLIGDQAVEALDDALNRAVRRHMISDVPVGVFLSGGIDSPLVAAKARQINGQSLKAFTIGVNDPKMDETEDARTYSKELELEHIVRLTNEQTALDLLDDVISATTEPNADFSIFPTLLVNQLASEYVKVILTGDGGDELFWGYPGRFVPMLQQASYFQLPKSLRYGSIAARKVFGFGYATREVLFPNLGRLFQKKHTLISEQNLKMLFPVLPEIPDDMAIFTYYGTNVDETAQWVRWNEYNFHLARVLMKADRASMHFSVETRLPLLDKEVINVALQTDWRSCLDLEHHIGKIPLRKVLRKFVRHQTLGKKGFTVPMHTWLRGPLQDQLQEYVLNKKEILGQPVNQAYLHLLNCKLLDGDDSQAWGLWLLLSLILWQEKHLQR